MQDRQATAWITGGGRQSADRNSQHTAVPMPLNSNVSPHTDCTEADNRWHISPTQTVMPTHSTRTLLSARSQLTTLLYAVWAWKNRYRVTVNSIALIALWSLCIVCSCAMTSPTIKKLVAVGGRTTERRQVRGRIHSLLDRVTILHAVTLVPTKLWSMQ